MARRVKLTEVAEVIRSKNAGPYELTLDIIFKDWETYRTVTERGLIDRERIARLYRVPLEHVLCVIAFDPAKAIKATLIRPHASGAVGETDVYGAQQHAPLLEIVLSL